MYPVFGIVARAMRGSLKLPTKATVNDPDSRAGGQALLYGRGAYAGHEFPTLIKVASFRNLAVWHLVPSEGICY